MSFLGYFAAARTHVVADGDDEASRLERGSGFKFMYVPSYAAIARAAGVPANIASQPPDSVVEVSVRALRLLLHYLALAADYDERTYLQLNPDVAEARDQGKIVDLREHFIQSGYFAGRTASDIAVDENWYLETYGDVADAVAEGVVATAKAHFAQRGEAECRSPNKQALPWIRAWAELLLHAPPPREAR